MLSGLVGLAVLVSERVASRWDAGSGGVARSRGFTPGWRVTSRWDAGSGMGTHARSTPTGSWSLAIFWRLNFNLDPFFFDAVIIF
jgi:hypothetical protein